MTAMTAYEIELNYGLFLQASGWHETPDGWVSDSLIGAGPLPLESAFELQHIVNDADDEPAA